MTDITDLTSTLRYCVALNDQIDVTLCYCVTVGAEISNITLECYHIDLEKILHVLLLLLKATWRSNTMLT